MSWQDYVQNLRGDNLLCDALILDNEEYWLCGASENFELKNFEQKNDYDGVTYKINETEIIKEIFKNKGIVPNPPGIYLNGLKYFLISFDEDNNICFLSRTNGGACIAMTNKCVVLGTWDKKKFENQNHGLCNNTVIKFQEYFIENDY